MSESVVELKLIDGKGEIFECRPTDDLFRAAIGGVGAVGIILEVVVQGVDRFNVEQHDPEGKFANEFTRRLFA